MYVIDVPRPYGHLVATGQKTAILLRRKTGPVFPIQVAVRNSSGVLTTSLSSLMEADGADLGTEGVDFNEEDYAVALVEGHIRRFDPTAENILKATSLLISGTASRIQAVYGQDLPPYALWLSHIRPLDPRVPIREHHLAPPPSANNNWWAVRSVLDRSIAESISDAAGDELEIADPDVT